MENTETYRASAEWGVLLMLGPEVLPGSLAEEAFFTDHPAAAG